MENFRFKIADIKYEASRLYSLKLSEDQLFEAVNLVPKDKLESLLATYAGSEGKPVNFMRWRIVRMLLDGTYVSQETLDTMIEEGKDTAQKKSFQAWGYFSILFPIINEDLSFNVKNFLREFGRELITNLNLEEYVAKPFVVDFKGPRNFGSDNVWMAIYNKSNPKQTTAIQLFLQIDYRGLICHLYDRLKDHFISSRKIEDADDMQQQVENFFAALKDRVISDDNNPSEPRYRELGVKTNSIFKISHDPEDFPTLDEIQYCIDQNIVVVHESLDPIGKKDSAQFESFKSAKKGDLFYLCWGTARCILIGQFEDDAPTDYELSVGSGWKQRKYRFLFDAISSDSFSSPNTPSWTPTYMSTCVQISESEYDLASELIFKQYFKVELKTDFNTELLPRKLGAASRQKISIDELVEPKLEVNLVAKELAGVIDNLDRNKGQMIGIFGSWGRGKTYLYNQMREYIDDNNELRFEYEHYTFNAWKYQETETIWAHLYDSLLEGYIGKVGRWKRFWKTFGLNIARKGWFPLVSILFNLIVTTLLTYLISTAVKFEIAKWLITIFGGAIGVLQAVYIYWRFYQPVKTTIESYVSVHNYNEVLGIQSEIQKELIVLVRHWLKKKSSGKIRKRLLLFVDDIDRCQEEKIISVLDALRVMLDNEELIERVIVLAAVDEKLLNRAIHFKYRNFELKREGAYAKNLVEEYMDKLFIAGIKLPKLNSEEQGVILRNYAINNDILERVKQEAPEEPVVISEPVVLVENPGQELVFADANPRDYVESQSEYFLLEKEMEMLNRYSDQLSESVTPRQLRIYMYRYLLAKNIASDYLWQRTGESQLSDEYCEFLAKSIALRSNNAFEFKLTEEELKKVNSPALQKFTPKLIEMVVPY
jgi:hypothetical protein